MKYKYSDPTPVILQTIKKSRKKNVRIRGKRQNDHVPKTVLAPAVSALGRLLAGEILKISATVKQPLEKEEYVNNKVSSAIEANGRNGAVVEVKDVYSYQKS